MCSRCLSLVVLTAVAAGCAPDIAMTGPARVLRVCADPNNLPFSNRAGEGFENRIAEIVAAQLDARLEYVWFAQRRGFVRNTLRAGECDVIIGVPRTFELAATTRPYYRSRYAFITRAGDPAPQSFDDRLLRTARVGVHIIGDDFSNSPPAHALSARGIITNVRGYSVYGDYASPSPPAELVRAVARRDIDIAIAWGPLAGYFIKQSAVPLRATPVSPAIDPPGLPFEFEMSMAVRRENQDLLRLLETILDERRADIEALLDEYGVPR